MMRFLKQLSRLLTGLRYHPASTYDIVIFDDYSQELLIKILNLKASCLGLNTRSQKFIFNFPLLVHLIKLLGKHSPRIAYYLAFLKCFNPKVVITYNPLERSLDQIIPHMPERKFLTISNGPMIKGYPQNISSRVFDYFYATNPYQLNLLTQNGSKIAHPQVTGQILNSYFMEHFPQEQAEIYDICLISQFEGEADEEKYCAGFNQTVRAPAELLGLYLKQHPELKVVVAMRSNQQHGLEEKFFRQHLGEKAQLVTNYTNDLFASYKLLTQSKIIIGGFSTLCLESIDLGRKTILVNYVSPATFQIADGWKYTVSAPSVEQLQQYIHELNQIKREDYGAVVSAHKFNHPKTRLAFQTIAQDIQKFCPPI